MFMQIDVKRAHFYGKARREMYVELPPEYGAPPGKVGLLLLSMYGTLDAGANWEFEIMETLLALGFQQGKSSP